MTKTKEVIRDLKVAIKVLKDKITSDTETDWRNWHKGYLEGISHALELLDGEFRAQRKAEMDAMLAEVKSCGKPQDDSKQLASN